MMSKIFFTIPIAFLWLQSMAQHPLEVVIANVKDDQGQLRVALFAKEGYLKKSVETKIVKAQPNELKVYFENVAEGNYVISVVHDANENGELDKNFVGMPKEGYAFSNNKGKYGAPDFQEASFQVSGSASAVRIQMIYW